MNAPKLTDAQRKALEQLAAAPNGLLEYRGPRGLGKASWERMMDRLVEYGLATRYVHGGFEITEAGKTLAAETRHVPKPTDAFDHPDSPYRRPHVLTGKTSAFPPCGCTVEGHGTLQSPVVIVFCPMHEAAKELLDNLTNVVGIAGRAGWEWTTDCGAYREAKAAVAKATTKK